MTENSAENVREYCFGGQEEFAYPEGGNYLIRAMEPEERREYFELLGKTKLEFTPDGKILTNEKTGEPVRVPSITEKECIAFAKRFVVSIRTIVVNKTAIDAKSPLLDKVLMFPGLSKEIRIAIDAEGQDVVSDKQSKAGERIEFGKEETWLWVIRQANLLFLRSNETAKAEVGN